ncbi:MAG: glycosyltransferase family 9 protein [Rhodospirillales bacterium]
MRKRWWLFRPFDVLARALPMPGPKRGLLIVRMDGVGDMVLFRGALDDYAEAFHVAREDITVLGCDSWAGLKDTVFAGFNVITINEHKFAKNPFYRFAAALRVRRLRAKTVVNDAYFRRALMADSLVWLAKADTSISSAPYISARTRPEFTWYLSQVDRVIPTGGYPTHELVRHARFLSAVSGRTFPPRAARITAPELSPPGAPHSPPPGLPPRAYAVLAPGSNEPGRRWPFAAYARLAEKLLAAGLGVVLTGRADETGPPAARAELAAKGCVDMTGATSLPQLTALMARARLVVVNDTGPSHLAIALGAPTVVILGGGHFGSFAPYPPGAAPAHVRFAHKHMDCYHCFWRCHLRKNAEDAFPCVAGVGEEDVWAACETVMAV